MIVRTIVLSAALLALGSTAQASEAPGLLRQGLFQKVSCNVIRYYVSKYSASAAETWARSHGATEAQIEAARHCLKLPAEGIEAAGLSGQ